MKMKMNTLEPSIRPSSSSSSASSSISPSVSTSSPTISLMSSYQTLVHERFSKHLDIQLEDPLRSIKLISVGDPGVGKSCLIRRFCEKKFTTQYISTIGIDYGVHVIPFQGDPLKIHFWDMAGHSSYFHVRNEFYNDTNGILLVYDVTSKASFTRLPAWIREIRHYVKSPVSIFLVGNKIEQAVRVVPQDLAIQFCKEYELEYVETSASVGTNVDELFEKVLLACLNQKNLKMCSESIE